jgi:hypothetical protein
MTRRLQACRSCRGKTRHANGQCAECRHRRGVVMLIPNIADPMRPTVAEMATGIPIGHLVDWHGTDCSCPTCHRDRLPGRYA